MKHSYKIKITYFQTLIQIAFCILYMAPKILGKLYSFKIKGEKTCS